MWLGAARVIRGGAAGSRRPPQCPPMPRGDKGTSLVRGRVILNRLLRGAVRPWQPVLTPSYSYYSLTPFVLYSFSPYYVSFVLLRLITLSSFLLYSFAIHSVIPYYSSFIPSVTLSYLPSIPSFLDLSPWESCLILSSFTHSSSTPSLMPSTLILFSLPNTPSSSSHFIPYCSPDAS